ncbi:MAG: DDE-type integrase/transposase/recombinase [Chloroflexi bacterium]|nr:DDE-type integrase/transposase/recombinase [Chloroflexota bacterium]
MDNDDRRAVALWRVAVLGPLISARLEHGDRRELCRQAAARTHQRPDGRWVRLSARTIEAWYYAYRKGGLDALLPQRRSDRGSSRAIAAHIAELVVRAKRERPRRSIRRIIRMLERARVVRPGELSRSSVHRLLRTQGISGRPVRGPSAERRSFLSEHAGDLWVGDAMHGPKVIAPDGRLRKSYLLSQIDDATRFVPHSFFALSEGAVEHEHGFKQALLKHGRPRCYYVDLGSAYKARSLKQICAELGIYHLHTQARDCEAKGVIERWHRTWRDEVGDELPDVPLPLAELNAKHWAWLGAEYHRRVHETTGRAPLEHWLDEVAHLRPLPTGKDLDQVFLHRERRKVRKDGTVRFAGRFYEVRAELVGKQVELRFDPREPLASPPRVFLDDAFVCDSVPLDRLRNTMRKRRRNLGTPDPASPPSGIDPLALIEREHYERTHVPDQSPAPLDTLHHALDSKE